MLVSVAVAIAVANAVAAVAAVLFAAYTTPLRLSLIERLDLRGEPLEAFQWTVSDSVARYYDEYDAEYRATL
jgi:hypothetical protein